MINIIVAITENNAIGKDNKLLFNLKKDLEHFKNITSNNIVIMGRKTFESIGKPLPNRVNVVLTKNLDTIFNYRDDIHIFDDIADAIGEMQRTFNEKEIFIIGGAQIYRQALENDLVDRIYVTKIKKVVEDADAFFPEIDYKKWCISDIKRYFEKGTEYFIYQVNKRKQA